MKNLKQIVLTGGPCSGKTTVLNAIKKRFGTAVVAVPEAATILLSGGFPLPGRDLDWSPEWQREFQSTICALQNALEKTHQMIATTRGARLLVCDRGLLDGAAYTPGGRDEFLRSYGVDETEALDRYAMVLHLESMAVAKPWLYGKANNESRYESLEEAQALDGRTRQAWEKHPDHRVLGGARELEEVINEAIKLIAEQLEEQQ